MTRAVFVALYGIFIAVAATWISHRPDVRGSTKEVSVTSVTWSKIGEGIVVPAKPVGVWTWAGDYVKGPALILIEAEGEWSYSPGKTCGPDGNSSGLLLPNEALMPAAPLGALLVKVGGSTAGRADGAVKVAGSKAIVEIGPVRGPIFLTINDEPSGLSDNSGQLTIKMSIHQLVAPPGTPTTPEPKHAESSTKSVQSI